MIPEGELSDFEIWIALAMIAGSIVASVYIVIAWIRWDRRKK